MAKSHIPSWHASYHQRTKKKAGQQLILPHYMAKGISVKQRYRGTGDLVEKHEGIGSNWGKARKISYSTSVRGSQCFHSGGVSYQEVHEQGHRSRDLSKAQECVARAEGNQRCRRVGDRAHKRFWVHHGKDCDCKLYLDSGKRPTA